MVLSGVLSGGAETVAGAGGGGLRLDQAEAQAQEVEG